MARAMSAGGPRAVLADKRPARHEIEELQEICLTGQCNTTKVEFRDRQHSHRGAAGDLISQLEGGFHGIRHQSKQDPESSQEFRGENLPPHHGSPL